MGKNTQETAVEEIEAMEIETLPIKAETAVINWSEAATVAKRNRIVRQEIIKDVLKPGIDFGEPFGGASKNVLLKPGAEKITDAFELYTDYDILDQIEVFNPSSPMFYYKFKCFLKLRGTDSIMATGVGSCNIRESKYWWREERPKCPMCECDTVYYDGKKDGYYCWSKKGGCGHNFAKDSKAYSEFKKQKTGRIQNPDMFDQVNTVLKMAKKRAHVDAVLNFGFSDKFTQDVEESGGGLKPNKMDEGAQSDNNKPDWVIDKPCPNCGNKELHKSKYKGTYAYCPKKCGFKAATEKDLNPVEKLDDELMGSLILKIDAYEKKFNEADMKNQYLKIIGEAGLENFNEVQTPKDATKILNKLISVYKNRETKKDETI